MSINWKKRKDKPSKVVEAPTKSTDISHFFDVLRALDVAVGARVLKPRIDYVPTLEPPKREG